MQEIQADTIKVGDIVTVIEWVSLRDNSWKGDVLEVLAVDLPFLALRDRKWKDLRFRLDTREVRLGALSREYVTALCGDDAEPAEQQEAE